MDQNGTELANGLDEADCGSQKQLTFLLLIALLVLVGTSLNAFHIDHQEGDELAYLALAREMNWDLTHYSTKSDPMVSQFPYSIYSSPLFHHPPAYPFLLKIGYAIGAPVRLGLLVQIGVAFLAICSIATFFRYFKLPFKLLCIVVICILLCPILNRSRTLIHNDALAGFTAVSGYLFYLIGFEKRSIGKSVLGGILLALSMNIRYSSILVAPLILIPTAIFGFRQYRENGRYSLRKDETLRFVIAAAIPVLLIGIQHYIRVYATYGSIFTGQIIKPDFERISKSQYLMNVHNIGRLRMLIYFTITAPLWLLCCLPPYWRALSKHATARPILAAIMLAYPYLLLTCLLFQYNQLRYFSLAMPFCYLSLAFTVPKRPDWRWLIAGVYALIMMVGASWFMLYEYPESPKVVSILFKVFPSLRQYYL